MEVLYFATHPLWPLTSGNRLRDYYLAKHLGSHFQLTFVEMCNPNEQPSQPPDHPGFKRLISLSKGTSYTPGKILHGMAGPTPLTVLNYFDRRSASQLASVLAQGGFDLVQVEGVFLSEYLPVIQAAPNCPAILVDWHNIESELMWRYSDKTPSWPKRLAARRTAALLERAELALLQTCGTHTVTSTREREKLLTKCPSANIHVVPNGVDLNYFYQTAQARQSESLSSTNRSLLFVGSMDYHANIDAVTWFVNSAWPEIAQRHPQLNLIIAGRNPSREVLRLTSDRVQVTGTVEDVRPFYRSALAVIVPLRVGGGTRLKILEAMAAGVPVVSTHLGAEGIDIVHNVHVLFADTSAEIADAIDNLARSSELCRRLVEAARNLVIDHYDWTVLGEALYRIYDDLIRHSNAR
jgi:glycosyltransferase involved in cell wall biosynthesis